MSREDLDPVNEVPITPVGRGNLLAHALVIQELMLERLEADKVLCGYITILSEMLRQMGRE